MSENDIEKKFSDVIKSLRLVESQRAIFGMDMPQTDRAIVSFLKTLEEIFTEIPAFSLVQKGQDIEVLVKDQQKSTHAPAVKSIPANLPSILPVFKILKVNSVTLSANIEAEELKAFFSALSMKVDELEALGGLKGYLDKKDVKHIQVDQMSFKLLKDEEHVGADKKGKSGQGAGAHKLIEPVWKDYFEGKLEAKDFKNKHEEFIRTALDDPKQFVKILKRILAKQAEVEKFLAHLEQKLFEIGFPPEAVEALMKKLQAPKRVMISEDELARLKKIEEDYQKNADERVDDTLEAVKNIKKKLTDEKERSDAILHQMSQGGMVLDKDENIVGVNKTAQNILGLSPEEIKGKNLKDVLKGHHLLTTVSDWQSETETHTPKEVKIQALDDETLEVIRESAIVIEDQNGRAVGVVSSLHNVTQQEEMQRRKNDVLDVIGHDLRAPLGAIKQNFAVFVQSAKDTEFNEHQTKFLDNCKNNITRMEKLIEKILDLRQFQTGKVILKYDTFDMNKLVEEAATSVDAWARNKDITIEVKADNMSKVDGDPERLYQVVMNLVSNAVKFTPEKGTITVTGKPVGLEGRAFVEISVRDSGIGIGKDDLKRIFGKYEQVSLNAPKGVSGLGLGLAICKSIVELHGGTIWAESKMDAGSTFTFQIPVVRVEE